MGLEFTPYLLLVIPGALIAAGVAFAAWRQRTPGSLPFALLMLAVTEWLVGYALELLAPGQAGTLLWARVEYLGIVSVPALWLVFVLNYTGRERWLRPRNLALLAFLPVVTLVMVWTNDAHHLHWSSVGLDPDGTLGVTYGVWFWVHVAYSYSLLLAGTVLLVQAMVRAPELYRGQVGSMLVATVAPWIGNGLYVFRLSPLGGLDLTPFAFTVTGLAMLWGMRRYRLLDIVPLARHAVVEGMQSAVFVLDTHNRVVDLNPAAESILGKKASDLVGKTGREVFGEQESLVDRFRDVEQAHTELALGEGQDSRYFDLRISTLTNRQGRAIGRLVLLSDVTDRKQQTQLLERVYEVARSTIDHLIMTVEHDAPRAEMLGYLQTIKKEFDSLN